MSLSNGLLMLAGPKLYKDEKHSHQQLFFFYDFMIFFSVCLHSTYFTLLSVSHCGCLSRLLPLCFYLPTFPVVLFMFTPCYYYMTSVFLLKFVRDRSHQHKITTTKHNTSPKHMVNGTDDVSSAHAASPPDEQHAPWE